MDRQRRGRRRRGRRDSDGIQRLRDLRGSQGDTEVCDLLRKAAYTRYCVLRANIEGGAAVAPIAVAHAAGIASALRWRAIFIASATEASATAT